MKKVGYVLLAQNNGIKEVNGETNIFWRKREAIKAANDYGYRVGKIEIEILESEELTDDQENAIRMMRDQGDSYDEINWVTHIPISRIGNFCRANSLNERRKKLK